MRKPHATRRQFLASSAALGLGSALTPSALGASLFVQGSDRIRVGLIGCGGRGTGAAFDTLKADPATVIYAVGDLFKDRNLFNVSLVDVGHLDLLGARFGGG